MEAVIHECCTNYRFYLIVIKIISFKIIVLIITNKLYSLDLYLVLTHSCMVTHFWFHNIFCEFVACTDVSNCLDSGKAVLTKYGYIASEFYTDIWILVLFCIAAQVYSYIGVLKKMKRQPAY